MWAQGYDPFGNPLVSTLAAAVPVVVLLGSIAFLKLKAHVAALLGIASSLVIAIFAFEMPAGMAIQGRRVWCGVWAHADWLDRAECDFSISAHASSAASSGSFRRASRRSRLIGGCNCC